MPTLLELRKISKSFMGTVALSEVDFELRKGEIHALMGENGAGKSTLIKVLTGVYPIDTGEIFLEGVATTATNPAEAVAAGISTVYQEVNLLPNLSVMENLMLGREPRGFGGIRWKLMRERAEIAVGRLGIRIDVTAPLSSLSIAMQQMVAIARALDVDAKVLILDEPTSSLDANEVEALFSVIRKLRSEGIGIVFVTHFLDQVYTLADRITVLRNGEKIGTWETSELSRLELVSHMIGRDASALDRNAVEGRSADQNTEVLIKSERLGRRGSVNQVDLELKRGETLALAGLLGSGRTEAARLIFGIDAFDTGNLAINGRFFSRIRPRTAIRVGIGYLSEDRKREGIFPELTVRENMLVLLQVNRGWFRRVSFGRQQTIAFELVDRLQIRPKDIERPIKFLSGGNQQKVLIARWLAIDPQALILDEPNRGIDVGAKFEIMSLVESLRLKGRSFIFISSELPELVRVCTKVLIMRDRQAVCTLEGSDISESNIVSEIAGA